MIYNDRLTPPANWPALVQHPVYRPKRRYITLLLLIVGTIFLILCVAALIIVFAVEHSWFRDNFYNGTQYGLWRLCLTNSRCYSWFSSDTNISNTIEERLRIGRGGINAWQALEIIFLFLTTATVIILILALITYRFRRSFHYYFSVLAAFCVWPAVCIGIASLFVFGFAVFNISPAPRDLDWCFYLNLAAVILALLGAILLSIYDALLKRPIKHVEDDAVIETFADLNAYPAGLSPSTFVIVRRNKKSKGKPYEYPQLLYPGQPYPVPTPTTINGTIGNGVTRSEYIVTNTNHQQYTPYSTTVTTQETNTNHQQQQLASQRVLEANRADLVQSSSIATIARPPQNPLVTQPFQPMAPVYRYQPDPPPAVQWRYRDVSSMNQSSNYPIESPNDYPQRYLQYPNRYNSSERTTFEQKSEPRVLHYYTGYDYFATVDPSDAPLTRHHSSLNAPGAALRYSSAPYYHSSEYIKSTM